MTGLNLRRLEYFVVLGQELHFGRAAERLHMAQPGLSQQIKVLEKECGVTLVDRTSRTVQLTEAGRVLFEDGSLLLASGDRLVARVREVAAGRTGRIRVVLTRSVSFGMPDKIVNDFRRRYPEVEVSADVAWTSRNVEMLRAGEVDCAFVRLPIDESSDIVSRRLGRTETVVVCPADHPLASRHRIDRADLLGQCLISWPRTQAPRYYDAVMTEVFGDGQPDSIIVEPDPEHLVAAVGAGRGVAVLDAERATTLRSDAVVIRRFTAPVPRFWFGVAWRPSDHDGVLASFLSVCHEYAAG